MERFKAIEEKLHTDFEVLKEEIKELGFEILDFTETGMELRDKEDNELYITTYFTEGIWIKVNELLSVREIEEEWMAGY